MSVGLVLVGTADPGSAAIPILADAFDPPFTALPVKIMLTLDFSQICPPGWPAPPDAVGTGRPFHPQIFRAGTAMTVFACVAKAMIAAGAATEV